MALFKPGYLSSIPFIREIWIKKADAENPEHQQILVNIAKKDDEDYIRSLALKKVSNPDDIAWIAINDETIGCEAVKKLADQKLLLKVVLQSKSIQAIYDAMYKITDQNLLAQIVKKTKDSALSLEVRMRITDPTVFADLRKDEMVKIQAQEKLRYEALLNEVKSRCDDKILEFYKTVSEKFSQDALLDIALNAKDINIRIEAIGKIEDEKILNQIKSSATEFMIRQVIRKRLNKELTEEDLLDIAEFSPFWIDRTVAISKLDSDKWQDLFVKMLKVEKDNAIKASIIRKLDSDLWQDLLAQMTITEKDDKVLQTIIPKLDSDKWQDLLAKMVQTTKNDEVIEAVLFKLDPNLWQDIFAGISTNTKHSESLRCKSIKKLSDKKVLETILKTDKSIDIRNAVYKRLGIDDSLEALFDIAKNGFKTDECLSALEKIRNQEMLTDILLNTSKHEVRLKAIEKISDENLLEKISNIPVKYKNDIEIRLIAIKKVTNENMLVRIAQKQAYEETGLCAVRKIKDKDKLFEVAKVNNYIYMKEYTESMLDSSNQEVLQYLTKHGTSFLERYNAYCKLGKADCPQAVFLKSCLDSSKTCQKCNNPVPMNSKAGGYCPHCGVRWSKEDERFV